MRAGFYKCSTIAATLLVGLLSGCSGRSGRSDSARDSKLEYEHATNKVETLVLKKTDFKREVLSNGKLEAKAKVRLQFGSSAVVREVAVENGSVVRKGSLVAAQESDGVELALDAARIAVKKSELDYLDVLAGLGYAVADSASVPQDIKSMARMRSGWYAARNSLRKAELDLEGAVVRAPVSGKIAGLTLRKYDCSGTEPFCTIIDDSELYVNFSVLESEYSFLEKGQEVEVVPFSGEPRMFRGKILSINPLVDKNGQVSVKAGLRNDGSLVDGMNVRISICRRVPGMLVVPKSAVVIRDNETVLFRESDGKALWTYVNVLMSNSSEYAVTANTERGAALSEGDAVIVSGNLNLADGSEVTVIN